MSTHHWQKSSYSGDSSNCLNIAATWQKSGYCSEGDACLSVAAEWQKSSYSQHGANCLDLAAVNAGRIFLRESDNPDVILAVAPQTLRTLIRTLKSG
ncbi:hypothetical protein SMD11_2923 [Streptomyces albireticuli]|uniref:DUF397 domain-containing protein n=1 Tax=Streptomyces albireticuli TaxID=1940 RepID=A0A1Z2L2P9_9ACTN|nr:DUF397 domain-containing protein [Streptomyces albireticuli]ARZ68570.1 hypothetical protein SMD11_2923 [Streptomyces albireticuli]